MSFVGRLVNESLEIELTVLDGLGENLERADLRRRKAGTGELGGTCSQHRCVVKRLECGIQPIPDRLGAGGRELLGNYDRGQPGKSVRTPSQRWTAANRERLLETRICFR